VQLSQCAPNPSGKLFNIKRGRPPEDQQGQDATYDNPHHYHGYVDECWPIHRRRRWAAVQRGKPDRLTGELRGHWSHLANNTRQENAEKDYICQHRVKLCISVENPQLATPDLDPLVTALLGEHDKQGAVHPTIKRIRECGLPCKWVCDEHGTKATGQAECRLHFCPHCLSDIGRDLDRARLPNLDPASGKAYRSAWLVGRYALPTDLMQWEQSLSTLQETWEAALVKIQRRKATKGRVLWRSFTAYHTTSEAWMHWKVMFKEDRPGAANEAIGQLCEVMSAQVYDERRFIHGELASLQLIENARSHLLGFSEGMTWEHKFAIFGAHYAATRGQHIFQGMGALWALIRELPEPEPLRCDECGARLRQIIEGESNPGPGEETTGNSAQGPSPPKAD
jgi:hypothetical protein